MKNLKQLTAITMCTLFATMQVSLAVPMDTGLGNGIGGAVINSTDSNFAGLTKGTDSATLEFKGNSHVNWNTLNINSNETLNFNATSGTTNATILNTVNNNMSKIYGQIKTNDGISQLIISNPNGVLFDGARFTTAGDAMITTKNMMGADVNNIKINDGTWTTLVDPVTKDLITVQILENSDVSVGGTFNIVAPKIVARDSNITTGGGLKLTTVNGADYTAMNLGLEDKKGVTFLKAMNIDGNVEIVNNVGAYSIAGTTIDGDLKAEAGGIGFVDGIYDDAGALQKKTVITGNADLTAHGQQLIARDVEVGGNIAMTNDGGAVELRNANVGGDADLTTTGWQPINHKKYNHYVHISGNNNINGDLNIESSQNIHIGNYQVTNDPYVTGSANRWEGDLLPGKLTVGGDIKATVTDGGHIMTTIDTTAKNIDYTAKSRVEDTRTYGGNILTDDKTTITAETYKFKSDGYIGGLKSNDLSKVDDKIIHVMEEYQFIPDDTASHEYMTINGGTISKIETPKQSTAGKDVQVYIKSNNNLLVSGANAGVVNLVAPDKKITITGPDVHAKEINVGGRTGTLQLDFPSRDFTTNYTNIKDGVVKTIKPTDEITYELTNKPNTGYNSPDFKQTDGTDTTYLVGPGGPVPPPPPSQPIPESDDNVRVNHVIPQDYTKPMAGTPIAYAADLDDEEDVPCRKNVDGSVTVVRAYAVPD